MRRPTQWPGQVRTRVFEVGDRVVTWGGVISIVRAKFPAANGVIHLTIESIDSPNFFRVVGCDDVFKEEEAA